MPVSTSSYFILRSNYTFIFNSMIAFIQVKLADHYTNNPVGRNQQLVLSMTKSSWLKIQVPSFKALGIFYKMFPKTAEG